MTDQIKTSLLEQPQAALQNHAADCHRRMLGPCECPPYSEYQLRRFRLYDLRRDYYEIEDLMKLARRKDLAGRLLFAIANTSHNYVGVMEDTFILMLEAAEALEAK